MEFPHILFTIRKPYRLLILQAAVHHTVSLLCLQSNKSKSVDLSDTFIPLFRFCIAARTKTKRSTKMITRHSIVAQSDSHIYVREFVDKGHRRF